MEQFIASQASQPIRLATIGFVPGQREHNLDLFRTLISEMPEEVLSAPAKKNNPAFLLHNLLLKFAKEQAGLSSDYFCLANAEESGLSTQQALDCIKDVLRTKRFLQAIDETVQKLAENKETVRVLDAGCGPMAILGIFAALVSDKVQCTCIELNKASACFARVISAAFGLEDRVKIIEADATKYRPSDLKFDLIVSETMFSAFLGEPIVQIFTNLSNLLASDGLTLPSKIDYNVGFLNSEDLSLTVPDLVQFDVDARQRHTLDSWDTVFSWKPGEQLEKIDFRCPLPLNSENKFYAFVGTTVHLGSYVLSKFDTNISWPVPLGSKGRQLLTEGGDKRFLKVSYVPGSKRVNPEAIIIQE